MVPVGAAHDELQELSHDLRQGRVGQLAFELLQLELVVVDLLFVGSLPNLVFGLLYLLHQVSAGENVRVEEVVLVLDEFVHHVVFYLLDLLDLNCVVVVLEEVQYRVLIESSFICDPVQRLENGVLNLIKSLNLLLSHLNLLLVFHQNHHQILVPQKHLPKLALPQNLLGSLLSSVNVPSPVNLVLRKVPHNQTQNRVQRRTRHKLQYITIPLARLLNLLQILALYVNYNVLKQVEKRLIMLLLKHSIHVCYS